MGKTTHHLWVLEAPDDDRVIVGVEESFAFGISRQDEWLPPLSSGKGAESHLIFVSLTHGCKCRLLSLC